MGEGDGPEKTGSIGDAYTLMDSRARGGQTSAGQGDNYTMPPGMSSRALTNPYPSREENVAMAAVSGTLPGIRQEFNARNYDKGQSMWTDGSIHANENLLKPQAEEIAARRDFARGEQPVRFIQPDESPNADEMNPAPLRAEKINPYGTATATYGTGPAKSGGTMKDIMGRTVPMSPYLRDQSEVQDTKFGKMPSTVPLGQDDAEQYRAIARGGKIPRSSKA